MVAVAVVDWASKKRRIDMKTDWRKVAKARLDKIRCLQLEAGRVAQIVREEVARILHARCVGNCEEIAESVLQSVRQRLEATHD